MKNIIIKPLGTVSPYPKGSKNCPGFLVTNGDKKLLLDCGNGSLSNLNMEEDLNNLKVIISHLHKDHYGDLLSLAYASYVYHNLGYISEPIDVYIPYKDEVVKREHYTDTDGWGCSRTVSGPLDDYLYLKNLGKEHYLNFIDYDEDTNISFGDSSITFKRTLHDICNYAVSIEKDGIKVCYSGDTGYDSSLANFFNKANLLICESTFLRGQVRNGNNHLYAYEAAKLAEESEVDKLLLTHFWPEISKKLYQEEAALIFENTGVCEENNEIVVTRKRV